jgi:hypothetical protein
MRVDHDDLPLPLPGLVELVDAAPYMTGNQWLDKFSVDGPHARYSGIALGQNCSG